MFVAQSVHWWRNNNFWKIQQRWSLFTKTVITGDWSGSCALRRPCDGRLAWQLRFEVAVRRKTGVAIALSGGRVMGDWRGNCALRRPCDGRLEWQLHFKAAVWWETGLEIALWGGCVTGDWPGNCDLKWPCDGRLAWHLRFEAAVWRETGEAFALWGGRVTGDWPGNCALRWPRAHVALAGERQARSGKSHLVLAYFIHIQEERDLSVCLYSK
jgi:hypothetical protein